MSPNPIRRPSSAMTAAKAPKSKQSFRTTLPGILTGLVPVLVVVGGLLASIWHGDDGPPSPAPFAHVPTTPPPNPRRFEVNLVVNGDAEAGCLAPSSGGSMPTWTRKPPAARIRTELYGSNGLPAPNIPSTGHCLFAAGPAITSDPPANDTSEATQLIDAGGPDTPSQEPVTYTLSALLGGYSIFTTEGRNLQDNQTRVSIKFLGADSSVLGSAQIGPVTDADRRHATTLLQRSTSGVLPPSATQILVTIVVTKLNNGPDKTINNAYDDGYADNVSVVLSPRPI